MSTLKIGTKSGEVAELQKLLNATGNYSLAADGIFGPQTESAVRDYQARSGLSIDGIVGTQTWGSLTTPKATTPAVPTVQAPAVASTRPVYTQSQAVTDALAMLTTVQASKPEDYTSQYGDQIQSLIDGLINRPSFQYDVGADPLYQQYSDMYQRQGKLAMQDTMGQAAALSGGYGNSYAQTVGQQTYNNSLQQMNSVIPELQNAAYSRYSQEGSDMRGNLSALQGQEAIDYGKYRDVVGDYNNDLNYWTGLYGDEYNRDYGQYQDAVSQYESDRSFAYQQQQDALAAQQRQQEYNLAVAAAAKKSSSGGGSSKFSADSFLDYLDNNPNLTDAQKTAMANQYFGRTTAASTAEALKKSQKKGTSLGR